MTRWLIAFSLLIAVAPARADDGAVAATVAALGALDPTARQAASDRLATLGESARSAIVAATTSDDPEIRRRAARALLALPWDRPDDPVDVQTYLQRYGQLDADGRIALVRLIAKAPELRGTEAMLRLIVLDPSPRVRWAVASQLIGRRKSPELAKLADLDADGDQPALWTAQGWWWIDRNQAKALALFNKVLASEAANPTDDGSLAMPVMRYLSKRAVGEGDYRRAAAIGRQRINRLRLADQGTAPVLELFALHADHGPLPGYREDVAAYGERLGRPLGDYVQARLADRRGRWWAGWALRSRALAGGGASAMGHYQTGDALADIGWLDEAEMEFRRAATLPADDSPLVTANARFRLAGLAEQRHDDAGVARELTLALAISEKAGGRFDPIQRGLAIIDGAEVLRNFRAKIEFHAANAARTRGDDAEADRRLDAAVALNPTDTELLMNLVPAVKQAGRTAAATDAFERGRGLLALAVEGDPADPEAKNNLAWFCARAGERLDEATAMAEAAVAAAPENPAYLDTLAETRFRTGRKNEALDLEKKALALQPGDEFMKSQVKRFSQ